MIPNLDAFDLKILRALRRDGRMSILDLADEIGMSATPVSRRVKALEASGIISGYCAVIDEAALGYEVSVFVSVKLEKQVDEQLETLEAAIRGFPEVVDCWLMTGNRDYLLRVVTRGLADFEQFLVGRLTKIPGVASIESSISLRRIKSGVSRSP
ncbi:MAG: Lrp/AsnC family transcriptional regulator [Rhodobacterales bacterium]|nr:Lrp/AsnC family transcriptional regulator [Rhodobacterales bacterium]